MKESGDNTMTKEELRIRFYALQKEYRPIMDVLTEKQYEYLEYLGFDARPSKLLFQPKVLFLGYNPAGGVDWWRLESKHNPHLFLWPHLNESTIMFFRKNAARKDGEWYELNKKENNSFPRQIIELLYELAALINPNQSNEYGTNQKPLWADDFEQSMMYLNLYPIATKDGETMISLFRKLCKEDSIPDCCKTDEWHLRMFFIRIMHRIVSLINPKLIVCMGSQTFHDYTYSSHEKHSIKEILTHPDYNSLIGFSRKGSWEGNIPNIAHAIYQRAFCDKE